MPLIVIVPADAARGLKKKRSPKTAAQAQGKRAIFFFGVRFNSFIRLSAG
jgi:hypothetical protein